MSCSKTIKQVCDGILDPCAMTAAQLCAAWDCLKERDRQLPQVLMSRCQGTATAAASVVEYAYLNNAALVIPTV